MFVTILCAVMMMAGLFIMLYAGVALIQDKRFFTSAPKEVQAAVQPRDERFPGAHALGWFLMERVMDAARKAKCHDFIMALPNGYDTIIGEGGASLSGGEKQRISIARAIMKDAPIIILDEATANVDPENENELMQAIRALTAEKTVIMIAHRLKTVEHADRILVVDQGRIVQQGTHEQLMAEDGIYRNFVGERREAASWKVSTARDRG